MEPTFSAYLEPWRDFYTLAGTAGVTLLGLLFVSASLNPRIMADDGPQGLRAWAGQTLSNLIAVLMLSLFCMLPDLDRLTFGNVLLVIGGQGLLRGALRLRAILRDPDPAWTLHSILWRGVVPVSAYVIALALAVDVYRGAPDALDWLVAVAFLLVSSGAGAAWGLLVEMGNREGRAADRPR